MNVVKPLVLASQSPRRIALLRQIGLQPLIVPSHIPEEFDVRQSPVENARTLAREKASEVARQFKDALIIGADTVVVLDEYLLAKPENASDAKRMLRLLSGKTHLVITAFALLDCLSGESVTEHETTDVTFRELPDDEIDLYVSGGSPMDKAGAYGIQDDYGAVFVSKINGCFYNVVGFPLSKFYTTLQEFQGHLMESKGYLYVKKD
ncbi:MAG: septum formation protein Maf [Bacteroidetes bacterium]|nr:septum formation protein Maf [Bacteroidota bacterium]MCW5896091.1 septum formation protein Maf [Bacteroidota bacterium]